jgi:two-component system LytT family response regulator
MIVDDEALARERLRTMLADESDIEIIAEYSDGAQAVSAVQTDAPDLLFLDVQMPELNGFDVISRLDPAKLPAIIFVTAHDQFALRAFEVHAVDYLLKPFDRERLQTALRRVKDRMGAVHADDLKGRLSSLLQELQPAEETADRLAVKASGRVLLVRVKDIDWVEASDNYVNIHVGKTSHLHRETMANMEKQLPSKKFIRISRSTIVNADRIQELQPMFHGEYALLLRDGTKLTLSRSHRDKLDHLLGKSS